MLTRFFIVVQIVHSALLVEYRLGMNFGQVFRDYSGRNNHGVNGDSSSTTTSDSWPTDRGAFFDGDRRIRLPTNDKVSPELKLSSTFSVLTWFLSDDSDGLYFQRRNSPNDLFYLLRNKVNDSLTFSCRVSGSSISKVSNINSVVKSKSYLGIWNLIVLTVSGTTVIVYTGTQTAIQVTLPSLFSESINYNFTIGNHLNTDTNSLKGYCWYFLISDSIITPSSYISYSSCSNCLSPTCTTGTSPSVIDPSGVTGCICTQMPKGNNCGGTACPSSTLVGCSGKTLLTCSCSFGSCLLSGTSIVCNCPSGQVALSTTCINCSDDCITCVVDSICSGCKASNALPAGTAGCSCLNGFYNTTDLTTAAACKACHPNCLTCTEPSLCLSCKDSNAVKSLIVGCECLAGFYNTSSLNSNGMCFTCYPECSSCEKANICLMCKDVNSSPSAVKGCLCNLGYYNLTAVTFDGSCLVCYSECRTCSESLKCTSCVSSNSSPHNTKGCTCNSGFYNLTALTTPSSCLSCYSDCKTCISYPSCTTCIALNSAPTSLKGCLCNAGYYNITSLTVSDSCLSCYRDCATCNSASSCLTCVDSNATPSIVGCICKAKFYNTTILNINGSCKSCHSDCFSCDAQFTCLTCIDSNSRTGSVGCVCNDGYYNTTSLSTDGSCLKCNSNCKTCSNLNTCTSCIDDHAILNSNFGCKCQDGYYNTSSLDYNGQCIACSSECKTCDQDSICLTCVSDNALVVPTGGCRCDSGFHNISSLTTATSCIQTVIDSLTLTTNISSPDAFFNYKITVRVYNQNSMLYDLSTTVSISSSTSNVYSDSLVQSTSTGEAFFIVYSKVAEVMILTASSGTVSVSNSITIKKLKLKIVYVSPVPEYTKNSFQVKVAVYNNDFSQLAFFNSNFEISLSLSSSGNLSGTLVKSTVSASVIFSRLRIISAGSYSIIATCPWADQDSSVPFSITRLSATGITIYAPEDTPAMNFDFEIFIEISDQNDLRLSDPDGTGIIVSFNDSLVSSQSFTTNNGTGSVFVNYPRYGFLLVEVRTVNGSISTSSVIEVLQNIMNVVVDSIPGIIGDVFKVTVTVVKYDGVTVDGTSGCYSVVVSWNPDALFNCFDGVTKSVTGTAEFNACTFQTSGEFELSFTSDYLKSVKMGPYLIIDPSINSITLSGPSQESAFVDFTVKVQLLDNNNQLLTSVSASLTISSTIPLLGSSLVVLTSTALTDLTFYCETLGTNTITVKASDKLQTFSIKIMKNQLKFEAFSLIVRLNQPNETTSLFNVDVSVWNFDLSKAASDHGSFLITLSLDPSTAFTWSPSVNTINGVASFSGLQINQKGIFYLIASETGSVDARSIELIIGIFIIRSQNFTISPSELSRCQDFSLFLEIYDQHGNLYIYPATVSITSNCSSLEVASYSLSVGFHTFELHSTVIGSCSLQVTSAYSLPESSGSVSSSKTLTFLKNLLKFQGVNNPVFFMQVFLSTDAVSFEVCIFDISGTFISNSQCLFEVSLSLSSLSPINGQSIKSSSNGCSNFSNLIFPNTESSTLTAKSSECLEASIPVTIREIKIQLSSSSLITTELFDVQVLGELSFENNDLYLEECTVDLTIEYGNTSFIRTSAKDGNFLFSFHFIGSGFHQVKASTKGFSAFLEFEVFSCVMVFQNLQRVRFRQTLTIPENFQVTIAVYDYLENLIQDKYRDYTIQITLKNEDSEFIFEGITSAGVVIFENVEYPRTSFELEAFSSGMDSVLEEITVIDASFIVISVISNEKIFFTKKRYDFDIDLYESLHGENSSISNGIVLVTVNQENFTQVVTDSLGKAKFSVVFNQSGDYLLEFYFEDSLASLNVTVNESLNLDPLCLIAFSPSICTQCCENSKNQKGKCECYEKSRFNSSSHKCECFSGLVANDEYCTTCGLFFKPSEVTSEFSTDFKSIFVHFAREVKLKNLDSCKKIIKSPEYLISISEKCVWISCFLLKIDLSLYPNISQPFIELNNYNVQPTGSECNFKITQLKVEIEIKSQVPKPEAFITTPETYSLECSQSNLQIFTSFLNSLSIYSWDSSISPENQNLSSFIKIQNSPSFEIPRSLLSESVLTIKLTTKFRGLETESSTSKVLKIQKDPKLSVLINYGSYLEIRSSQEILCVAIVTEFCGSSEALSYKWKSDHLDASSFQSSGLRSDSLLIPSNSLKAGKSYLIKVEVSQSKVKGSSSLLVLVKSSDLVISLTRSSGSISKNIDFQVDCSVVDPDDDQSIIEYLWFCVEDSGECIGSSGHALNLEQDKCLLTVGKENLRSKAKYFFTVKAQTGLKNVFSRIEVYVDPDVEGVVEVSFPSLKVNSFYVNNLIPKVECEGNLEFLWSLTGGEFDNSEVNFFNPFIGFPEFSLEEGNIYQLELKISSDKFDKPLVAYGTLITNKPPACKNLSSLNQGESWILSANECVDGDNEDYPLTYQFGFYLDNDLLWINEPISISVFKTGLPDSVRLVSVRVFDTLESWAIYDNSLSSRNRELRDYMMEIMTKSRNPLNIPSVIIEYSIYELDYPSFSYLYSSFYSYFSFYYPCLSNLDLFISCLSSILKQSKHFSDDLLNNSTQLTTSVVQKYRKRLFTRESEAILEILQGFIDRINSTLIFDLFVAIGDKWVVDTVPNIEFKYDGFVTAIKIRKIAQAYLGLKATLNQLEVAFPPEQQLNKSKVFDSLIFLNEVPQGHFLYLMMKSSGNYESYNLELEDIQDYFQSLKKGVSFSLENNHSYISAVCINMENQDKSSCQVEKVNKTHIVVNLHQQGNFYIEEGGKTCEVNNLPITISAMTLVIVSAVSFYLILRDRKQKNLDDHLRSFTNTQSISSLFKPKQLPYRLISMFKICSKLLVLFALIIWSFTSSMNSTFSDIYKSIPNSDLGRGLGSIIFLQVINLVSTLFSKFKEVKKAAYIELFIYLTISILAFTSIVLICSLFCINNVTSSVINWAIFALLELILIESFWALGISFACRNRKDSAKVSQITSYKKSRLDENNLNDTENFSPKVFAYSNTGYNSSQTRKSFDNFSIRAGF